MKSLKRNTLLNTAERLFYEEGFHATGIDRVVKEAGVTRMTLYNHFPSKTELIRAVLAARHARYREELRAAIEMRGGNCALTAIVGVHEEWLRSRSRHGCMVIKAIAEFEHQEGAIAEDAVAMKRDLLEIIDQALELDNPAGESGAEGVLMVLEGTNALVPILGVENAIASMRTLLAPWLSPLATGELR